MEDVKKHKTFIPEKYGMIFCPRCDGHGKIHEDDGEFRVCTVCGGFGAIRNLEDKGIRTISDKRNKERRLGQIVRG